MTDDPHPSIPSIDSREFWRALGARATGAAVVTTARGDERAGFFALSATHLTAEPPTVMVTLGKSTSASAVLLESRQFAVNYLAAGQDPLIAIFSGKTEAGGDDRFNSQSWSTLKTGAPVLEGAAGSLDCVLVEVIERYDALIVIGRIVGYRAQPDANPLVFHMGKARALNG